MVFVMISMACFFAIKISIYIVSTQITILIKEKVTTKLLHMLEFVTSDVCSYIFIYFVIIGSGAPTTTKSASGATSVLETTLSHEESELLLAMKQAQKVLESQSHLGKLTTFVSVLEQFHWHVIWYFY